MTEKTVNALFEALGILYLEQVDYIALNALGDPHHNRSMKMARRALDTAKKEVAQARQADRRVSSERQLLDFITEHLG